MQKRLSLRCAAKDLRSLLAVELLHTGLALQFSVEDPVYTGIQDSVDSHEVRACPHYPQPYDCGLGSVVKTEERRRTAR
jgi:hypothetical protein